MLIYFIFRPYLIFLNFVVFYKLKRFDTSIWHGGWANIYVLCACVCLKKIYNRVRFYVKVLLNLCVGRYVFCVGLLFDQHYDSLCI